MSLAVGSQLSVRSFENRELRTANGFRITYRKSAFAAEIIVAGGGAIDCTNATLPSANAAEALSIRDGVLVIHASRSAGER